MDGIEKSFPGVRALRSGRLHLRPGEIHALVGENGAGKSTLIKILSGAQQPDAGEIRLNGRTVRIRSPHQGLALGIAVIYQEFNLVPTQTVRENLFLGRERARFGLSDDRREAVEASRLFEKLGVRIDLHRLCRELSVAEQQLVEIAKAVACEARILVMDEPTAALSEHEVIRLFALVRDLKRQGVTILYVSHRLDEIFALCDRVTVMRDGEHTATGEIRDVTRQQLIEWMVGRRIEAEFPKRIANIGEARLKVENLSRGESVRQVSFEIRRGEILGLAGLVGAGRTETARLLFGADRADSGTISLDGKPLRLDSPRAAIAAGICLLTEDRKNQGLVPGHSVLENFGLPNLERFSRTGFIREREERDAFARYKRELSIKVSHDGQAARNLSGGNQQKVVLAKWLQADTQVIIFDEPTRGVDVGARVEIYLLMHALAASGKCVFMISSELPEILGLSDRILVLRRGRITGEISNVADATQQEVLNLAMD